MNKKLVLLNKQNRTPIHEHTIAKMLVAQIAKSIDGILYITRSLWIDIITCLLRISSLGSYINMRSSLLTIISSEICSGSEDKQTTRAVIKICDRLVFMLLKPLESPSFYTLCKRKDYVFESNSQDLDISENARKWKSSFKKYIYNELGYLLIIMKDDELRQFEKHDSYTKNIITKINYHQLQLFKVLYRDICR
jgi:hypothetical protein